jgi:septal ring factor EnvC (AmiA/AmiB activator)
MRHLIASLAVAVLLQSSYCYAQETPQQQKRTPEDMQKIMGATFDAMVPAMAKMTEAMVQTQLRIAVLPDTADRIATFKKNLYDALKKSGFTESQAMQIVIATGLPSATPAMK